VLFIVIFCNLFCPFSALLRRRAGNGKKNLLGEGELVDAITSGRVELDDIDKAEMPASLQAMAPAEQIAVITEQTKRRDQLNQQTIRIAQQLHQGESGSRRWCRGFTG